MDSEKTFDVAIIGGGVIGCAIAWRLAQAGVGVVLVERAAIGSEASMAAGGMLAPQAEADEQDAFFELATASRSLYSDLATELLETTGINVEYRTEGTLFPALTQEDESALESRWKWQQTAGLRVERLTANEARRMEPFLSERVRWALRFPDDHQVNNRHLLTALEKAARHAGAVFIEHTEVRSVEVEGEQITGVLTSNSFIQARHVVIAAGSWSSLIASRTSQYAARMAIEPVRGQMLAFKAPIPAPRCIIYSRRGYLIPRLAGFLIGGSTSERVGFSKSVTPLGVSTITQNAIEIMPIIASLPIIESWAGLRPATSDGWPVVGRDPQIGGLFYATGHYRNGILLTPITAVLITDLIVGRHTTLDLEPFSVTRFAPRVAAG